MKTHKACSFRLKHSLTLALVSLALVGPGWAQTVSDASFETTVIAGNNGIGTVTAWPSYGDNSYAGASQGSLGTATAGASTGRTGVNGGSSSKTLIGTGGGAVTPAAGSQVAVVNPGNAGECGLSQSIAGFTVNNWYTISFAAHEDNGRTPNRAEVSVTDGTTEQYVWSEKTDMQVSGSTMFTYTSQPFKTTATSMTIRFGCNFSQNAAVLYGTVSVAAASGSDRMVGNLLADANFENVQAGNRPTAA